MHNELKWRYLKALMLKDVAWYDKQNINELPTEVYINLEAVERASGLTIGFIMFSISACITGLGAAFYAGVYLGIIFFVMIPYVLMLVRYRVKYEKSKHRKNVEAYKKSGADAEE